MHYTTVLAFATAALAAPARFMPLANEEWTIENMQRRCTVTPRNECVWTFKINQHKEGVAPTDVRYVVNGTSAVLPSRSVGGPSKHGIFTVTSTWSDYFGVENAWTTMSVIDYKRGVLIYPAYTDKQLAGGKVVKPDQTYVPESIPK
jgi:hypothetical protein